MKYYLMCKKVLGQKIFDELVKSLTDQIIKKFSKDIFLDIYMEILEYNIKIIMIISICNVLGFSKEEKEKRISLKENKKIFIADTVNEFEEENYKYIKKITDLLK